MLALLVTPIKAASRWTRRKGAPPPVQENLGGRWGRQKEPDVRLILLLSVPAVCCPAAWKPSSLIPLRLCTSAVAIQAGPSPGLTCSLG